MRRSSAWARACAALVALAGGALAIAPLVGAERWHVVAAVLPARAGLAVAAVSALVACVLVGLSRRCRGVAVPFALSLALVCVLHVPVVLHRGVVDEAVAAPDRTQLRLLEWNTNGALVTPRAIADLAREHQADVVVLPQKALRAWTGVFEEAFAAADHPMVLVSAVGYRVQVAVWVTPELAGHYPEAVPGPDPYKSVVLPSADPGLPTLVAVHAPWPVGSRLAAWERDVDWVADTCSTAAPVVVAGDFNGSTDDFGGPRLGRCDDAASLRGAAAVGTWPTRLPPLLGMPIDHVLLTPEAGEVSSFTVLTSEDGSGARHRPTMTVVDLSG